MKRFTYAALLVVFATATASAQAPQQAPQPSATFITTEKERKTQPIRNANKTLTMRITKDVVNDKI